MGPCSAAKTSGISIHAPRVGCDTEDCLQYRPRHISIHAPRVGCDEISEGPLQDWMISIHAPRVGCDNGWPAAATPAGISIHAPRVGCDTLILLSPPRRVDFNPRTPCGVRPHIYIYVNRKNKFQSTHPVWGATSHRRSRSCYRPISIHAPRVGCDVPVKRIASFSGSFQSTHPVWGATCDFLDAQAQHSYFNPRTPCGVRHIQLVGTEDNNLISIHAPRVGCDLMRLWYGYITHISIHAPRVGCDDFVMSHKIKYGTDFNPRTPCGVRQDAPFSGREI